jgi:hypothetical protein
MSSMIGNGMGLCSASSLAADAERSAVSIMGFQLRMIWKSIFMMHTIGAHSRSLVTLTIPLFPAKPP